MCGMVSQKIERGNDFFVKNLTLSEAESKSFFNLSQDLDELRASQTSAECTEYDCVFEDRNLDYFDPEMDLILENLDLEEFENSSSPSQNSNIEHLFDQEFEDIDSPLSDLFASISTKSDNFEYNLDQKFDFTAGNLNLEQLQKLGLKQDNLDLISEGLKVQFKKNVDFTKLKPKPNSKNVNRNRSIVRQLIDNLEGAGHVSRSTEKPVVVSPLNLVPKANGSPRLIHNLKRLNKFIARGPKVKHLEVLNLSKNFCQNTFFCKLDLKNGYYHIPLNPEHRKYFGFCFERQYYVFNVLSFGYKSAPDFFQYFMQDVCTCLGRLGVNCAVELDDVIINEVGYLACLKASQLAISILQLAGFRINFTKSVIRPTQIIDYLGFTLNAQEQCYKLTDGKLTKCRLMTKALFSLKSVSRKLLERILGFLNFVFSIFPLGRSFIRVWYTQLQQAKSDFTRIYFRRSPLCQLREFFFSGQLVFPWPSGVAQPPLTCFVDATPDRVAGISCQGGFSTPLFYGTPIFEAELLAAYLGIVCHLPFSNNLCLVGDNSGVLFVLKKGCSRNLTVNFILQQLARVQFVSPFLLSFRYINTMYNPADVLTRYFFL